MVSAEPPNAEPAGSALAAASAVPAAPAAPPILFSHSIAIRNLGRGTANNVRIGHNRRPPSVTTAPKLFYQHGDTPEGGWEILIPTIVAKESIQIAYMYPNTYTWRDINTYCKSDEGSAEVLSLDAIATPPAPKWRRMVGTVLLLVGIATTLYYAIIWGYWLYSVRGLPFTA